MNESIPCLIESQVVGKDKISLWSFTTDTNEELKIAGYEVITTPADVDAEQDVVATARESFPESGRAMSRFNVLTKLA